MTKILETDLILNQDESAYHLKLLPEEVADTIITVGDPERVEKVSRYFDSIEVIKENREFVTHTGFIGNKRLTVISTGIGTDNIDIVLNELDALVNIDRKTRQAFSKLRKLNFIRIGTSGALQPEIEVDKLLVSEEAIGLDSLMHYYIEKPSDNEKQLLDEFKSNIPDVNILNPYVSSASSDLISKLATGVPKGITITAPGFYAPQGRRLRARLSNPRLLKQIMKARMSGKKITNLEMETAGIYGLAACLGHRAISFNVILANRATNIFSKNPEAAVEHYIKQLLETISDKL